MATGEFKVGLLQEAVGAKSVAGAVDVNLTSAEAKAGFLHLSGALTGNISVIVPAALLEAGNSWVVYNATTGDYALTFKGASGSGVVITRGKRCEVYFDGTNMVAMPTDFSAAGAAGVLGVNTADSAAIASTASEANFSLNAVLLPNFLTTGRVLRVTVSGKYSDTGTPTLQLKLKMGSVTLLDLGAVTLGSGVSNKQFQATFLLVVRTTGVSGTVQASLVNARLDDDLLQAIANVATVDTTIAETLQLSAQWSASSASNTATLEVFLVEALN